MHKNRVTLHLTIWSRQNISINRYRTEQLS